MLEVLHHRRFLQSSLVASVFDTLVRHPHTHHHLALPYMLYPPGEFLGLRPLAYRLGPYHYVLHPHMLHPHMLHPHVLHPRGLHPRGLYPLARRLAFGAHCPPFALHTLGPSLGPQAHMIYPLGLHPLAYPLGPSLALHPVVVRALVPNYFPHWVLKYSLEYHLSRRRLLNNSSLVFQVHFDQHIFLRTRTLREVAIQDLSILLDLVFVALPYLARLSPRLFLTHSAYPPIPLASRSLALFSASIYSSLTSYGVSLFCAAR